MRPDGTAKEYVSALRFHQEGSKFYRQVYRSLKWGSHRAVMVLYPDKYHQLFRPSWNHHGLVTDQPLSGLVQTSIKVLDVLGDELVINTAFDYLTFTPTLQEAPLDTPVGTLIFDDVTRSRCQQTPNHKTYTVNFSVKQREFRQLLYAHIPEYNGPPGSRAPRQWSKADKTKHDLTTISAWLPKLLEQDTTKVIQEVIDYLTREASA